MAWLVPTLVGVLGFLVGAVGGAILAVRTRKLWQRAVEKHRPVSTLIEAHFRPVALSDITVCERLFPFRVRADLQRAVDRLFASGTTVCHFCGVRKEYAHEGLAFSSLIV